jgi:hypothetical protein
MNLPPELLCMVKSSLPNRDLYFVELTCRYFFWCPVSNKEWQLRECKLWNQSPSKIISEVKNRDNYCLHVLCWKHRCQYLSFEDIKCHDQYAPQWAPHWGHLPVVQYLCEKYTLSREEMFIVLRKSFIDDQLDVVQYLCNYYELTKRDILYAMYDAIIFGSFACLKYLREHFEITADDIHSRENNLIRTACRSNCFLGLKTLCEIFRLTTDDLRPDSLLIAVNNKNPIMVKYFCEHFSWTLEEMCDAINVSEDKSIQSYLCSVYTSRTVPYTSRTVPYFSFPP